MNDHNTAAFQDFALERGSIPFIVRGNIDCGAWDDFSPLVGIRIYPPTTKVKAVMQEPNADSWADVFVEELHEEAVFLGEIDLPEKTPRGVSMALWGLERWADLLCLALGNPSLKVEVQLPLRAVITMSGHRIDEGVLDRWVAYLLHLQRLSPDEKKRTEKSVWWYRKACSAARTSLFECYTAHWNTIEVLCGVSGSRINVGETIDKEIQQYLSTKRRITAGHILECYNKFVNHSIPAQMRDSLVRIVGDVDASQIAFQCFEVQPMSDRLYQIRNDINHGNIRENSSEDHARVYRRNLLLSHISEKLLCAALGHPLSIGKRRSEKQRCAVN